MLRRFSLAGAAFSAALALSLGSCASSESIPGTELAASSREADVVGGDDEEVLEETAFGGSPVYVDFDKSWEFASFSRISTGRPALYPPLGKANGLTVAVNAGHGTKGGDRAKTLCHPDGSPKVVSGSTSAGAVQAVAVSEGITFSDGTKEPVATLSLARLVCENLRRRGYAVLMIRDGDDVQLDNIARTVFANNLAACHVSLHYDSTARDKGVFFLSSPDGAYRKMPPVSKMWKQHHLLGESVVGAVEDIGFSLYNGGSLDMDLTQTSYSTVPSIDLEVGDTVSDHGRFLQTRLAHGIANGIDAFFKRRADQRKISY